MMVSNDRITVRDLSRILALSRTMIPVAPCLASRKRRTVVTEHHVRFSDPRKQPRRVHSSAEGGQTCQVSYPAGGSSSCRSRSCVASLTERCSSRSWLPGSSSSCWCSRGRRTRPRTPRRPQARPTPRRSRQSQRLVQWPARPSTPRHTPSPGNLAQRPQARVPPARAPAPQAPAAAQRTLPRPPTAPGLRTSPRAPARATRARALANRARARAPATPPRTTATSTAPPARPRELPPQTRPTQSRVRSPVARAPRSSRPPGRQGSPRRARRGPSIRRKRP